VGVADSPCSNERIFAEAIIKTFFRSSMSVYIWCMGWTCKKKRRRKFGVGAIREKVMARYQNGTRCPFTVINLASILLCPTPRKGHAKMYFFKRRLNDRI
jgi:hypothetical protein